MVLHRIRASIASIVAALILVMLATASALADTVPGGWP
jgi:hypothetical protein